LRGVGLLVVGDAADAPDTPRAGARVGAPLAGIVLAAGESRRMGRPKATIELDGKTFLARVLEALGAAAADPIVVVTGRHRESVRAALRSTPALKLRENPAPELGQLSSLKVALRFLIEHAPRSVGAIVALVDHPAVRHDTVAQLARAARESERRAAVRPVG